MSGFKKPRTEVHFVVCAMEGCTGLEKYGKKGPAHGYFRDEHGQKYTDSVLAQNDAEQGVDLFVKEEHRVAREKFGVPTIDAAGRRRLMKEIAAAGLPKTDPNKGQLRLKWMCEVSE